MVNPPINPKLSRLFIELIANHVGLAPKNFDPTALTEKLLIRLQALNLASAEEYYRLLESATLASQREWPRLIPLLTNNETYFFRDREQVKLLRSQILPELIQRKHHHRHLRICSAGCSSGEEPYSLAILLQELIPNLNAWQLVILGIDIDEAALQRAKQGIYTAWSFRGVSQAMKQRYFHRVGHQYHLAPETKRMVQFKSVNLVKDPLPQKLAKLEDIDLLICRNVFIYFDSATIAKILEKFYNTLHPQGYFIPGHTELHQQDTSRFHKQVFTELVVYRRQEANSTEAGNTHPRAVQLAEKFVWQPRKNIQKKDLKKAFLKNDLFKKEQAAMTTYPHKNKTQDAEETIEVVKDLYHQKSYRLAIQHLEEMLIDQPHNLQACRLMARIYANLGRYEAAIHYCYQALEIDAFFVPSYYLLAQIAEEQGNSEEAKRIYKQIIYLEPNSATAYFELSQIYQQAGDRTRTFKMQQTALELLKQLPSDTPMEEKDDLTAAELILQIEDFQKLKSIS
ncbi:MAG: CheR family methyltransferase [Cyanophyceae cyanobacterium]